MENAISALTGKLSFGFSAAFLVYFSPCLIRTTNRPNHDLQLKT